MRRTGMMLAVAVLMITSCGGGDDDSDEGRDDVENDQADGGDDSGSDADVVTGQSDEFDVGSLPDDFPVELVPPDWDTGQYSELLAIPTATFESSMSFEDAVAYYDGVHGEGIVVGNDPGERLAQWTRNPPWIISVFEGDPMLISISNLPEE